MNLEPGIYKIKDTQIIKRCHYLHIFYQDKKKFYRLNASLAQPCDDNGHIPFEGYKLIKKLSHPIAINKVKLHLEWQDADGDEFEFAMRDIQLLRTLFTEYPEIAKAFGSRR